MTAALTTDPRQAALTLRQGGLVAFGTETVYGLGANAFDVQAVARVFEAKGRPTFDPLIVHVSSREMLSQVVAEVPPVAEQLINEFWPGPLTLVLPKRDFVPDLVTAGLPTVGVRMPAQPLALEMIEAAGVPVAAPSANPFGRVSPTTAEHVIQSLGDRIDMVLDCGPCEVGLESTIVSHVHGDAPTVLRLGGLTVEEIEATIGPVPLLTAQQHEEHLPMAAPGSLARHYAPRKPLTILREHEVPPPGSDVGVLTLMALCSEASFGAVEILSQTGSLTEAAARFFGALRRLDAAPVSRLYAHSFPDHGLGRALNDRLTRAAAGAPANESNLT
ncbi:MAG: threonylcarbamoyl-AMP synthase [Planctomycetaceae bacterium]|nr:threonylcarbamoyl-AMP synthase [Planctomycetaceae bacterium]